MEIQENTEIQELKERASAAEADAPAFMEAQPPKKGRGRPKKTDSEKKNPQKKKIRRKFPIRPRTS